jgi:hypothetical protein
MFACEQNQFLPYGKPEDQALLNFRPRRLLVDPMQTALPI